jgi:hypothetical protein
MTTEAMRKQLIRYLEVVDDKKIKGLYALLEENISERNATSLTPEQLAFLEKERREHLAGIGRSYSWDEAKQIIRRKKAS